MVVTTHRDDESGNETITREIYFDIGASQFRIRTEQSTDGGASWQPGRYGAVCRRPPD